MAKRKTHEPEDYEELIGQAILNEDPAVKELALRRYECRWQASRRCFCYCGNIHDMKTINLLVNEKGETKAVCCCECRAKQMAEIHAMPESVQAGSFPGWTWQNWNGITTLESEEKL